MIRRNILFLSLCAMGVLAAVVAVCQMWFDILEWQNFLEVIATIIIVGSEISFLIAIDYDLPSSRRKSLLMGLVGLSVAAVLVILGQIWFTMMAWPFFIKTIATLGIAFVLVGFLMVVIEDFHGNKKLKDQNYID